MKYGLIKNPTYVRKDKRGLFLELINYGKWKSLILGSMHRGAEMGHHYHRYTIIFYYLLTGGVEIKTVNTKTWEKQVCNLLPGEGFIFRPEEIRVITYKRTSRFIILKSHPYNAHRPDLIVSRRKF